MIHPSKSRLLCCLLSVLVTSTVRAGQPSGPYLVWADLTGQSPSLQTQRLHEFNQTEPDDRFCGEYADQRVLYLYKRPNGFSNALLSDALVKRDGLAKRKLAKLIRTFHEDGILEGIDGVIVFTRDGGARFISFDANKRIRESRASPTNDRKSFAKSFCAVLPEVFRD